ncbi:MAG: MraZ family transcriptional regulator [Acidobacteriota bacterium]|nr:MraZ family transcriptional regulator [Acidobacteriota bacterium]
MLTGTYQRTLDSKTRVTLPSDFRREFDEKVCLIPFSGALYGFTPDGFKAWVDSQFERDDKHYDPRNRDDVRLRRGLTAACQTIDVDAAGRMALGKLGAKTLDALAFGHDVTVIGADDHFEVWDAKRWEAENASFEEDLLDLMFGAE